MCKPGPGMERLFSEVPRQGLHRHTLGVHPAISFVSSSQAFSFGAGPGCGECEPAGLHRIQETELLKPWAKRSGRRAQFRQEEGEAATLERDLERSGAYTFLRPNRNISCEACPPCPVSCLLASERLQSKQLPCICPTPSQDSSYLRGEHVRTLTHKIAAPVNWTCGNTELCTRYMPDGLGDGALQPCLQEVVDSATLQPQCPEHEQVSEPCLVPNTGGKQQSSDRQRWHLD